MVDDAFAAGASGFVAGRAMWLEGFRAYPEGAGCRAGGDGAARDYMADICAMADADAADWRSHPCYGAGGAAFRPDDARFRQAYADFGV